MSCAAMLYSSGCSWLAVCFDVSLLLLQAIAQVCAVCSEARIECKAGVYKANGAPTEAALVVLAEKLGVPDPQQQKQIASARSADPENSADSVQRWYCDK